MERTVDLYGGLDFAVNAAAVTDPVFAPSAELPVQEFDEMIAVALRGVWLSMKYEIPAIHCLVPGPTDTPMLRRIFRVMSLENPEVLEREYEVRARERHRERVRREQAGPIRRARPGRSPPGSARAP